jgi:hypothetical protein
MGRDAQSTCRSILRSFSSATAVLKLSGGVRSLSESRGGTPTGEPRPKRRPVATSAGVARRNEIKLRLSAFRFPSSFPFVPPVRSSFVIALFQFVIVGQSRSKNDVASLVYAGNPCRSYATQRLSGGVSARHFSMDRRIKSGGDEIRKCRAATRAQIRAARTTELTLPRVGRVAHRRWAGWGWRGLFSSLNTYIATPLPTLPYKGRGK